MSSEDRIDWFRIGEVLAFVGYIVNHGSSIICSKVLTQQSRVIYNNLPRSLTSGITAPSRKGGVILFSRFGKDNAWPVFSVKASNYFSTLDSAIVRNTLRRLSVPPSAR